MRDHPVADPVNRHVGCLSERSRERERPRRRTGRPVAPGPGRPVRPGRASSTTAATAALASAGAGAAAPSAAAGRPVEAVRGFVERGLQRGQRRHERSFASPRSVSRPRLTRLRTTASETRTDAAMSLYERCSSTRARTASAWSGGSRSSSSSARSSAPRRSIRSVDLVVDLQPRQRELAPRPVLHLPLLDRAHQPVARDAVQPRQAFAAVGLVALRAQQRGRERLRRQVRGELRVLRAAHEVPEHRRLVPPIEHAERGRACSASPPAAARRTSPPSRPLTGTERVFVTRRVGGRGSMTRGEDKAGSMTRAATRPRCDRRRRNWTGERRGIGGRRGLAVAAVRPGSSQPRSCAALGLCTPSPCRETDS